jgi:hypothetical protein
LFVGWTLFLEYKLFFLVGFFFSGRNINNKDF